MPESNITNGPSYGPTYGPTNGSIYGMTPQGFIPKRLAHILDDLNANIANITNHNSGSSGTGGTGGTGGSGGSGGSGGTANEKPFQNAADDSILQQVLGVFAEGLSECWEAAYDGSVQFDPLKNSGAGQAGTIQLNAMLLKPGEYTIVQMELGGKPGTVIPKGSLVSTADENYTFATTEAVNIASSGMVEVEAQCNIKGPVEPELGTVISIQTPLSGWLSAANIATIALGSWEETEGEARRRQQRSTSLTSYRQIEAIYAAVMNVPGVIYCRAYQNNKKYPQDERGIPFKEVAVVAEGGDPHEIASALFLRFPVGIIGYGNTSEVFYDKQGISYAISFSRPQEIAVSVAVDVVITNRADFPDTGAQQIKQAILDYAEYGGQGNENGFPPGANIVCSRLYTPVNSVPGHKVTRLQIASGITSGLTSGITGGAGGASGESPEFSNADIPVAWNEVGRFDLDRISVNVTVE